MNNYYYLGPTNPPLVASAFAPEGTKLDYQLIPDLIGQSELPFNLQLIKLSFGNTGLIKNSDLSGIHEIWLDYQPNSLAWPLMSSKLKSIIELNLTGNEGIDWIFAIVKGNNEVRTYYIPRFGKRLDVLDLQKTKFVPGTDQVMIPFFSLKKISELSVFHQPLSGDLWKITSGIYVNEKIKKQIQKEKLTGMTFEKVRVV